MESGFIIKLQIFLSIRFEMKLTLLNNSLEISFESFIFSIKHYCPAPIDDTGV